MTNPQNVPHNLRLFRLQDFAGRQAELAQVSAWLQESPVVAITGAAGAGKSSLATAVAHQLMPQYDEGVIWVDAYGGDEFRLYDVIRTMENVLVTGIAGRPPDQWPILVLQQLYGRRRLIVIDGVSQATETAVAQIAGTAGRAGPGGAGRVIFVGRDLPPPLLQLAGNFHLKLYGLPEAEAAAMLAQVWGSPPSGEDVQRMVELCAGHPLALKLLMPFYAPAGGEDGRAVREQLHETVARQPVEDGERRFEAMVEFALQELEGTQPAAAQLLTRFTLALGGGDADAMGSLYWTGLGPETELAPALEELVRRGLLEYDGDEDRYLLHPAVRRFLVSQRWASILPSDQRDLARRHADYYLGVAREYERTPPQQWNRVERDWANIRQGVEWTAQQLETAAGVSTETLLDKIDNLSYMDAGQHDDLALARDYALALRAYCVQRQPPSGLGWLAAGLAAARLLGDTWARTLIGGRLCTLAYLEGRYDLAEAWLKRSLNALIPLNDKPRLSRVWSDLGTLYKAQGRYSEAIAVCEQWHSLHEGMGNWQAAGAALMRIGSIYYADKDMEQALDWHERARALFHDHGDPRGQAAAHNNIGLVYEARGDLQQAMQHYQESTRLNETLNNRQGAAIAYGNLGSASFAVGDWQAALEWYQKDLAVSEQTGDWVGVAATLHNMGQVALEVKDLAAARDYFARSRDLYQRFGLKEFAAEEETLMKLVGEKLD
jgi:tetratricopeptide (TPR) repeat protein/energy-coupling factor transporter ATP-binding protein EcfA2